MSSTPIFFDRVLETSTTTGTGTYTLAGAVTGYQAFSVVGNGNSCYYCSAAVDGGGTPTGGWEVGVGTYTASGTTLSRDSIQASSNAGSAVSWAAGTRRIFLIASATFFGALVSGPSSATGNNLAAFNGTTGKLLQDSGKATPSGAVVGTTDSQTLTNKTLTAAVLGGTTDLTGGQIKFPSSQSSSSNANTLDDYEEGDWTPTITGSGGGSGQTYSVQVGKYVKIGKLVSLSGAVTLSAKGTITTNVLIAGLPFTSLNVSNYRAICSLNWNNLATAFCVVQGTLGENATSLAVIGATAATTGIQPQNLTTTDINNTSRFTFSLSYVADV